MEEKNTKLVWDVNSDSVIQERKRQGIKAVPLEESPEEMLEELEMYKQMLEEDQLSEVSTAELIGLISVLSNGYIKPDVRDHSSLDGVRDTKRFFPIIEVCFEEFLARIGKTKNEITAIISKTKISNEYTK